MSPPTTYCLTPRASSEANSYTPTRPTPATCWPGKPTAAITTKPRGAVAIGKQFFYRQVELGNAAAYDAASKIMACNMMDDAALEGVQAFIEKRPPRWNKE